MIKVLSPKASTMLARRCLHGVVRDVWKTKPGSLASEIAEIKGKVTEVLWEAIDAVRKVGNFSAHLAEDAGDIPVVKAIDAQRMLDLIEILFREWYVRAEENLKISAMLEAVKQVAEKKTTKRGNELIDSRG